MRKIQILYLKGKFALSVDGVYQNIKDEADLVNRLVGLGITQERAADAVGQLKKNGKPLEI